MKTAKREAEDKIKEAEDSVKQMKLKKAEAEEKQIKLQREISGLKQAWGVSNSTRDKEIRMIKQAEALNLQQQLEKAKRQAFEEGEESGQVKFQKTAQAQAEKQQQLFAQGQLTQAQAAKKLKQEEQQLHDAQIQLTQEKKQIALAAQRSAMQVESNEEKAQAIEKQIETEKA